MWIVITGTGSRIAKTLPLSGKHYSAVGTDGGYSAYRVGLEIDGNQVIASVKDSSTTYANNWGVRVIVISKI